MARSAWYSFLVALNARYLWRLEADLGGGARLFERLVVPGLRRYWGGDAQHFGWPRTEKEDGAFRAALPRLASRMRERLSIPPAELSSRHKDLAVDAVAWRPLDERRGQTVLLCQCAIGDDWDRKGVPLRKWETLFNFAVAPTNGLAFPFIPDAVRPFTEVDWLLLCAEVGVPFDRMRVAHLVDEDDVERELLDEVAGWTAALEPALSGI